MLDNSAGLAAQRCGPPDGRPRTLKRLGAVFEGGVHLARVLWSQPSAILSPQVPTRRVARAYLVDGIFEGMSCGHDS